MNLNRLKMIKKGNIVVYIGDSSPYMGAKGVMWTANKVPQFSNGAYNPTQNIWCHQVRCATKDEAIWFRAGAINVNQIPEVGGEFKLPDDDKTYTIKSINLRKIKAIETSDKSISLQFWLKYCSKSYKPPNTFKEVFNGLNDLIDAKVSNLTFPESRAIQMWAFKQGCMWSNGSKRIQRYTKIYFRRRNKKKILYRSSQLYAKEINKELILNYIKQEKQLNYESNDKKTEIECKPGRIKDSFIKIPTKSGKITSASRLIGNTTSGRSSKSEIRRFKISTNVITC